ncbi:hypothetical protein HPB47_020509, partial [Ixodes persulcatus]
VVGLVVELVVWALAAMATASALQATSNPLEPGGHDLAPNCEVIPVGPPKVSSNRLNQNSLKADNMKTTTLAVSPSFQVVAGSAAPACITGLGRPKTVDGAMHRDEAEAAKGGAGSRDAPVNSMIPFHQAAQFRQAYRKLLVHAGVQAPNFVNEAADLEWESLAVSQGTINPTLDAGDDQEGDDLAVVYGLDEDALSGFTFEVVKYIGGFTAARSPRH